MRKAFAEGTLRYGCIGAGLQGGKHVEVIALLPNTDLVAVCDINEESARQAGLKFGARHALTDYEELLALNEIDAVSIALPDHTRLTPSPLPCPITSIARSQ